VLALIGTLAAADAVGAAFSPYLLVEHPLALIALNADDRHVILLASRVELPWILLVAIPRRLLSAIAAYGFGACYGRTAVSWAERRYARVGRMMRWIERLLARVGAPLLVLMPGYTLGVLSGASASIRVRTFLPCVALGQVFLISGGYFFGSAISAWTDAIVAFASRYVVETTAVFVTIVVVQQGVAALRRRRQRAMSSHENSEDGHHDVIEPGPSG
jgi:hypothetical protein